MLAVVWFLMMMMMMKSEAAELITVRSGEPVQLTPKRLKEVGPELWKDIRWTHQRMVLSLQYNRTRCHNRRCAMQNNGTLTFSHVQSSDAGNYSLEVYDAKGRRLMKEDFQLTVEWAELSHGGSSVLVHVLIVSLILIFIITLLFITRRRFSQMTVTRGPVEENLYMAMHGNRVNKKINEEDEKKEREESLHAVSTETPMTEQKTVEEEEDIYV